jgi:hypothetical protein
VVDGKGIKSEEAVAELCKKRGCKGWRSWRTGGQEKRLQGLKKLEQRWARKRVERVEEVKAEVGKERDCKGWRSLSRGGQEKRLQGLMKLEQRWMERGVQRVEVLTYKERWTCRVGYVEEGEGPSLQGN